MRRHLVVAATALLMTACGSTVQIKGTVAAGSPDGLSAPAATGTTAGGLPGTGGLGTTASASGTTGSPAGGSTGIGGTSSPGSHASAAGAGSLPPGSPVTAGADHSRLTIGMLITTASGLASTGYKVGNTVNEQDVDQALVNAFNKQGGLAGHPLKALYAKTDTFSSNWETDFNAACATFTQDNKVNAVLGYAFNYYASFEKCLSKKAIPHLSSSFNIPDRQELAQFPSFVAVDVPTVDRRGLAKVDGALGTSYLTAKNKVGILTDNCPGSVRSLDNVVLPFMKRAGLPAPTVYTVGCINGQGDSGSASADLQGAELSFSSKGVDRVLIHGVSEGPGLAQFAVGAQSQGYHPGYIVSSLANLALNNGTVPPAQARNIHGFGWLPMEDIAVATYPKRNANQARCLALLKSQGITPSATADYVFAYQICEPFFLYEAALRRIGGTSAADVVRGVHSLGSSYQSITNLDGQSLFTAGRSDAILKARPLIYGDACNCWSYQGAARQIPSP